MYIYIGRTQRRSQSLGEQIGAFMSVYMFEYNLSLLDPLFMK